MMEVNSPIQESVSAFRKFWGIYPWGRVQAKFIGIRGIDTYPESLDPESQGLLGTCLFLQDFDISGFLSELLFSTLGSCRYGNLKILDFFQRSFEFPMFSICFLNVEPYMDRTIHIFWYVELDMDRKVHVFWHAELNM